MIFDCEQVAIKSIRASKFDGIDRKYEEKMIKAS